MYADAILSLLALLCLGYLFYGPWQEVCTDVARQFIFERRDQLFDLALEGKLSFESKEYRTTRNLLEAMIRYAHECTWPYLVFQAVCQRPELKDQPRYDVRKTLGSINDPGTRKVVERLVLESTFAIIAMMGVRSVLILPVGVLLVCARHAGLLDKLEQRDVASKVARKIQTDAMCAQAA
jgi:hypothetical protein